MNSLTYHKWCRTGGVFAPPQLFSNCSKSSIVKRLRAKAPVCFRERNINVCGNSRVEEGEECDPGLLHINNDRCCTSECKLRGKAKCRWVSRPSDRWRG